MSESAYFSLEPSSDDLRYDSSNSLTGLDMMMVGTPFKRLGANPIGLIPRIGNKMIETSISRASKSVAWTKNMKNSLNGKNLSRKELKGRKNALSGKKVTAGKIGSLIAGAIASNWTGLANVMNGASNQSSDGNSFMYGSKRISRERWV